jgi:hypothetical protein
VQELCHALNTLRASDAAGMYRPGSAATAELETEPTLSHHTRPEPVRDAHMHASLLTYFVIDHLDAMAALLPNARVGPVYACWSVFRPIFETTPVALWIADPTITAEQRVRRAVRIERDSVRQELNLPIMEMRNSANRKLSKLNTYRARRRWTSEEGPDEQRPVASEQFVRGVFGDVATARVGPMLWRLSSATAHADAWALKQVIVGFSQSIDGSGRGVGALEVRSDHCLFILALGALAALRVAQSNGRLFGRDLAVLDGPWRAAASALRPHVTGIPINDLGPEPS